MEKCVTRCLILVFCTVLCTGVARSQCAFDIDIPIQDASSVTVQILVEGLVNSDLAAGQSLCAVDLHFRHSYLGDLTIELMSPAGQVVQLVGPPTTQINPTNLTVWQVRFLQCGFPAAPDPGFTPVWNNNQAWQFFTTYT